MYNLTLHGLISASYELDFVDILLRRAQLHISDGECPWTTQSDSDYLV